MTQVLALHGFTGAPDTFAALARSTERLQFLCPALCGHGTEPDLSASDFAAELARLAAWVKERASIPLPIVGYSLGARVALGLCLTYPELFSRAVLIGVNPGISDPQERAERVRWEQGFIDVLEKEGLAAFLAKWEELPLWASQGSLPAEVRAEQRRIRASHRADGLAYSLRVLGAGQMPDYFPELSRLKVPTLLVVGENDLKFRSIAERAQALLQDARVAVLPGAGHNPLIEAPRALLASLEPFLTAPTLATPHVSTPPTTSPSS